MFGNFQTFKSKQTKKNTCVTLAPCHTYSDTVYRVNCTIDSVQ